MGDDDDDDDDEGGLHIDDEERESVARGVGVSVVTTPHGKLTPLLGNMTRKFNGGMMGSHTCRVKAKVLASQRHHPKTFQLPAHYAHDDASTPGPTTSAAPAAGGHFAYVSNATNSLLGKRKHATHDKSAATRGPTGAAVSGKKAVTLPSLAESLRLLSETAVTNALPQPLNLKDSREDERVNVNGKRSSERHGSHDAKRVAADAARWVSYEKPRKSGGKSKSKEHRSSSSGRQSGAGKNASTVKSGNGETKTNTLNTSHDRERDDPKPPQPKPPTPTTNLMMFAEAIDRLSSAS
eukprot:GFYU01001568.1.p1 GENE.GFYU01001568.1~~GFYU01001568.1.p1  ORF type:complete len:295 (-),score=79.93 GFYU01001568.1:413-1297(-)